MECFAGPAAPAAQQQRPLLRGLVRASCPVCARIAPEPAARVRPRKAAATNRREFLARLASPRAPARRIIEFDVDEDALRRRIAELRASRSPPPASGGADRSVSFEGSSTPAEPKAQSSGGDGTRPPRVVALGGCVRRRRRPAAAAANSAPQVGGGRRGGRSGGGRGRGDRLEQGLGRAAAVLRGVRAGAGGEADGDEGGDVGGVLHALGPLRAARRGARGGLQAPAHRHDGPRRPVPARAQHPHVVRLPRRDLPRAHPRRRLQEAPPRPDDVRAGGHRDVLHGGGHRAGPRPRVHRAEAEAGHAVGDARQLAPLAGRADGQLLPRAAPLPRPLPQHRQPRLGRVPRRPGLESRRRPGPGPGPRRRGRPAQGVAWPAALPPFVPQCSLRCRDPPSGVLPAQFCFSPFLSHQYSSECP